MKKYFKYLLFLLFMFILLVSCVSHKKLTYLQYSAVQDDRIENKLAIVPSEYKIRQYDNLFVRVITPDPQWSELFNPSSGGAGGQMTQESASLISYQVDINGEIEIPFVGKFQVVDKTLAEIKTNLDSVFSYYLKDASITVRLVNNYISILGEVNSPGRYPITKDRINIFEALAMAGDLTIYSNRQKIQLIRPSQYGSIVKEVSLLDRNILQSEFYYLMPNDIIYAEPIKGRAFQMNASVYSVLLSTISTIITVLFIVRAY